MTLLRFCGVLFLVNALTIGGGYVMLPLLQQELVVSHQWLTNQEFLDAIAIGQVTPGPLTVMNAFLGYKMAGLLGALLAMVSTYLPSLLIVLPAATFYYRWRDSRLVAAGVAGMTAAVVGLLAAVAIPLGKTALVDLPTIGIAVVSFGVIALTDVDPTVIILGAGAVGAILALV